MNDIFLIFLSKFAQFALLTQLLVLCGLYLLNSISSCTLKCILQGHLVWKYLRFIFIFVLKLWYVNFLACYNDWHFYCVMKIILFYILTVCILFFMQISLVASTVFLFGNKMLIASFYTSLLIVCFVSNIYFCYLMSIYAERTIIWIYTKQFLPIQGCRGLGFFF